MSQTPEKLLLEIARARLLNRPGAYEQFKFEWDLGGLRSLWSIENMFGPPATALSGIFPPREIEAMHYAQMTAFIDKWAARQPPPRPIKVEALPPLSGTVVVATKVSGSLQSLKKPNQPQAAVPAPVVGESAEVREAWQDKARQRAREIIARQRARDLYPPQIDIADEIAREFRTAGVVGADGKPLSGASIKRHALNGISSAQGKRLSTAVRRSK